MKKLSRIINVILGVILCIFFVASVVDTHEVKRQTNFDQAKITAHVENLSANGPRSIADKEANEKAAEYIRSQVESYGLQAGNKTQAPSYAVQEYVAVDEQGRYQNWDLKNVIAHIPANSTNRTGEAIMFMAHFDSVPMGQGASDDGVSCAVMLEAIRYYMEKLQNGYVLDNDLLFCFVNGEEYGLYGSKALLNEFTGFDNVVDRVKFCVNLESRGTSGTLIMFETGKNNYNTVQVFSQVNRNVFTCSIATMVYDMMPNYTDFTTFKDFCQGVNMANITGGENYHTQNDSPENLGTTYLSQQAQIVDGLIDKLANYRLQSLYEAEESAIFFSYLNMTTVIYNHTAAIIFAAIGLLMLVANILLSIFYRKQDNWKNTAKAIGGVVVGLLVSAVAAFVCYYVFQLVAVLFGVIDIHMVGTITYSNTAIVVGLGILSLATSVLTTHFACKWLKIERRDMTRAFAYIHVFLGIVLSFVLPDASYLFMFSGILLMANELLITCLKNVDFAEFHGELLATALYFPIVIPVIVLATSALGMTMSYVYGLVFALTLFGAGVCITPVCEYVSVRTLIRVCKDASMEMEGGMDALNASLADKSHVKVSAAEGALHILAVAMAVFFVVSVIPTNASVNLQGKQNIAKLPYDDALVYVLNADGDGEYRIYDLNSVSALKKYAPKLVYTGDYYVGEGEEKAVALSILSTAESGALTVRKTTEEALVYLDFSNATAQSFTVDDGKTQQTYAIGEDGTYSIKLHGDCTVTLNGGSASIAYKEVVRDYAPLIPQAYAQDSEQLHFNLWLTKTYTL